MADRLRVTLTELRVLRTEVKVATLTEGSGLAGCFVKGLLLLWLLLLLLLLAEEATGVFVVAGAVAVAPEALFLLEGELLIAGADAFTDTGSECAKARKAS